MLYNINMTCNEMLKDFSLNQKQIDQFERYADLLIEWNEKFNLTAILDKQDIYVKHFLDCLLLAKSFNLTGKLIDVGTGAGFPGIVLKIFLPELEVTLLEPNGKKCLFLNEVINQLQLQKIEVINQRAEDFKEHDSYDFATARAVSQLNILLEIIIPLVKVNGHFLAMKGPKANEEIKESENAFKILDCKVNDIKQFNFNDNERNIIDIVKIKQTNNKYPRHYSQIKKKPL